MKPRRWWQNALVYLGYSTFFLVAFVVFIYLTLPLDTFQSYLVRKLSDEHGMDLTIGELDTWRLTGLDAENVVIRRRPSPEELAAITAAREARKQWDEQNKGKSKAGKERGEDGATRADGGAGETAELPSAAAPEAGDDAPGGEATAKSAGEPPVVPTGPAPIEATRVRARVGLWALLRGHLAVDVRAEILGGKLDAELSQKAEAQHVKAQWSDLDLRQIPQIREALQVPVAGQFAGNVDLEIPLTDDKKPRWANALGHLEMTISDAAAGPGRVESKKFGAFGFMDMPLARIASVQSRLAFDKKKAVVERFDISGKDVEGELTGHLMLDNALDKWAPRLHIRFKVSDEFLEANKDLKVLLGASPWIKQGMADGFIGISINGTFKNPTVTPKPVSPYKKGGAGGEPAAAKAESGDARKNARDKRTASKPTPSKPTTTTGSVRPTPSPPVPALPRIDPPQAPDPEPVAAPEPEPAAPETEAPAPETEAPAPETEAPAADNDGEGEEAPAAAEEPTED
jgi:type II secretion system protein N